MDNHTHLMVVLRDREELDPGEAIQRWNSYAYIYEAGSRPKGGKEHGVIVTDAMKARLKKYGMEGEAGSLVQRTWEYSKSIKILV